MKPIKNQNELSFVLASESLNWQETIYDQTGVIPTFRDSGAVLISNCGYIDLDSDAEYQFVQGADVTKYYKARSIKEFIAYILEMESYYKYLVNETLGQFDKATLFWAIYDQVISPVENQTRSDCSVKQDWAIHRISTYAKRDNEEVIDIEMSLIEYDAAGIWIPKKRDLTLATCLDCIAKELNSITADIEVEEIPRYNVHKENVIHVPNNYPDLKKTLHKGGAFDWVV